jgi:hypothetical protein
LLVHGGKPHPNPALPPSLPPSTDLHQHWHRHALHPVLDRLDGLREWVSE